MSVVQGQAVRRRAGVAPNTLVMAEASDPAGHDPTQACPVKGCSTRHQGDADEALHIALQHPRHSLAQQAREYLVFGGSTNYQRKRSG